MQIIIIIAEGRARTCHLAQSKITYVGPAAQLLLLLLKPNKRYQYFTSPPAPPALTSQRLSVNFIWEINSPLVSVYTALITGESQEFKMSFLIWNYLTENVKKFQILGQSRLLQNESSHLWWFWLTTLKVVIFPLWSSPAFLTHTCCLNIFNIKYPHWGWLYLLSIKCGENSKQSETCFELTFVFFFLDQRRGPAVKSANLIISR